MLTSFFWILNGIKDVMNNHIFFHLGANPFHIFMRLYPSGIHSYFASV